MLVRFCTAPYVFLYCCVLFCSGVLGLKMMNLIGCASVYRVTVTPSGTGAVCGTATGAVAQCSPGEGLCPAVNCAGNWTACDATCEKIYVVGVPASTTGTVMVRFLLQVMDFCTENDRLCTKNDGFYAEMIDYALRMMDFMLKTIDYALRMMDFMLKMMVVAGRRVFCGRRCGCGL